MFVAVIDLTFSTSACTQALITYRTARRVTLPASDPVFRSARREAAVVLAVWAVALVYTVSVCYWLGYGRTAESLRFMWGFPDWVFWGIVVPWWVCLAITAWFAFGFMTDDDLGADVSEAEPLPGVDRPGDQFAAHERSRHA